MACSHGLLYQPLHNPLFPSSTFTKPNFCHSFKPKIKARKVNNYSISLPEINKPLNTCFLNPLYASLEDPEEEEGISTNMWWAEVRGAIGQRFNLEGIICSVKVLTKDQHLLLPHVTVDDIRYIDWDQLHKRGFKGVIFDKDNTLTKPYCLSLYDPLRSSLEHCKAVFGENRVAILSNSAGLAEFDPNESKARALERRIGLKVIRHKVKKPAGDAEDVEKQLGCLSREVVMVGDRRFTDAVYGNRNGFLTVFTKPLSGEGEPFVVKRIRNVEDYLVKRWFRKGLKPVSHCLLSNDDVDLICLREPLM
ncbi:phosphatidylglycerophosphate phosphatase 1, chloroplastic/mitochondrial [Silene latifolia]|uniref:phosphatidylglycerophosphate phosphatase 1, chloroplastic/mitochondrial n=1 Tax=Silene latifolia TaxID=37657 RepID=UPI003D76DEB2